MSRRCPPQVWDFSADASKERLNWLEWNVDSELMDWAGLAAPVLPPAAAIVHS